VSVLRFVTRSPEETRSLGERLSHALRPGDVLVFKGDMGAGKSVLARGIAGGLGITGPIASPTFTILQAYDSGRLPFYHFDWYRITSPEELFEMGMEEYLGGDGAAVVEWPERAPEALPEAFLQIALSPGAGEDERIIEITPVGGFRSINLNGEAGS
jgi:tRNA threonylcarbamoyladenosine biosynthesis protein TsaE